MLHRSVLLCDNRQVLFLGGRSNLWHLFRRMQLPCNCHAEKLLWVKTKVQKARKKRRLSAILPSRASFCNFMQLMHRERPITYPPQIKSAVQCCAYVRFDAKISMAPIFNENSRFRQERCLEQIETSLVRVLAESVCSSSKHSQGDCYLKAPLISALHTATPPFAYGRRCLGTINLHAETCAKEQRRHYAPLS